MRTSRVVPTNKIKNAIRSGVMTKMLIARANSEMGVMSPVAGRRQRHRSVVEAIQKRQPIALGVEVAVAVDVDDPGGEQQRHHSDDHPA